MDGLTVRFDEGYGIHWDTDNANITTTEINATSNLMSGLFVENDEGPITLSGSYICNQNSAMAVGGLVLRNTEGVSLTNGVLMNNLPNQITVIGILGGIDVTNWVTGKTTNLFTQNFTNQSNTIQGNTSSQGLFKDSYLNGTDWTNFQTTFKSSSNTWWNSQNSTTPFVVPTPKKGSKDDFTAFKSATLQDSSSSFKQPTTGFGNACNLTPVGTDFWFTVDNAALTMTASKPATFNLTLTPLNFTSTANITLDGITELKGLSSTLSANSIKTSGTSVLTVTTALTTLPGTYSITVLPNTGSIHRTGPVQLTFF